MARSTRVSCDRVSQVVAPSPLDSTRPPVLSETTSSPPVATIVCKVGVAEQTTRPPRLARVEALDESQQRRLALHAQRLLSHFGMPTPCYYTMS